MGVQVYKIVVYRIDVLLPNMFGRHQVVLIPYEVAAARSRISLFRTIRIVSTTPLTVLSITKISISCEDSLVKNLCISGSSIARWS